ncbi:MAG: hypothetical protein ACFCD0_25155 [Gemmataceae bacterium]
MDKATTILLDALKRAISEPTEQRLFKSGKLKGLFEGRGRLVQECAQKAIDEGFLEVVHEESHGTVAMSWVRPTPKAAAFVHNQESAVDSLEELREVLKVTQAGLPVWMEDIQSKLQLLSDELTSQIQAISHRLNILSERVDKAIERAEQKQPQLPEPLVKLVPWSREALNYLDQRIRDGGSEACSLPELFSALRQQHPKLTILQFHEGIRRLFDRNFIRLLSHEGPDILPEPEYAFLDGIHTYYYVGKVGQQAA